MISCLLNLFGANCDYNKNEIYLHWGIDDLDTFNLIQKMINKLSNANTRGKYDDFTKTWTIKYG